MTNRPQALFAIALLALLALATPATAAARVSLKIITASAQEFCQKAKEYGYRC